MTAAQTYIVDVVFHGKDQGAQAMANTIGGSLSVLQGHLDRAAAGMERLGMIGVAAVGGVAAMGVRALARDMVQLNSVTQDTEIGIAGMLQANGGAATFADGMRDASSVLASIRRDADALPGEAQDFVNVFSTALPAALQAGMSNALDVSRFTNQFAAVGIALHVDADQSGRDLRLLLQGRAGAQVAMWNQLQSLVGKTAEEFNAMSAPQRLTALQGATGRYADMVGAFSGTFSTALTTVMGKAHRLEELATRPLFDRATARLQEMGSYLTLHAPEIELRVQRWGDAGVRAFDMIYDRGKHALTYLREHWREIASEVEATGRRALTVYAGLRAGSAAVSAVQTVGSLAGAASSMGLGGAGGAAGGAGIAAATPLAVGGLLAVGAAGLAIHDGAFDTDAALRDLQPSIRIFKSGLTDLGEALRPVVVMYGSGLLEGLTTFVSVMGSIVGGLATVASYVVRLERELVGFALDPLRAQYRALFGGGEANGMGNAADGDLARTPEAMRDHTIAGVRSSPLHAPAGPARTPHPAAAKHHITINNRFEITQADNPERVAMSVMHVIQRELRNPTQSARPGLTTLRR
jgi:hypothetical protein